MKLYEGHFHGQGHRYALVASRFNSHLTQVLVEGARDCLARHGVAQEAISLIWVPGAFEIPLVAQKCARSGLYDAVICLGAVIRGETAHFDYVAGQAASGITQACLATEIPIIFGLLTTENQAQAVERAGGKSNQGFTSALTALEMVNLLKTLPRP